MSGVRLSAKPIRLCENRDVVCVSWITVQGYAKAFQPGKSAAYLQLICADTTAEAHAAPGRRQRLCRKRRRCPHGWLHCLVVIATLRWYAAAAGAITQPRLLACAAGRRQGKSAVTRQRCVVILCALAAQVGPVPKRHQRCQAGQGSQQLAAAART